MANIKQQMKRNKTNEKRRQLNASFKSSMKTAIKAVGTAVDAGDKEKAQQALNFAVKKLDKAQAKGILHKNHVARRKASLSTHVNAIS